MEKVYSVRAVAEVCKLKSGTGTHRRSGIDFGLEPILVSDHEFEDARRVSAEELEAVLLDDLLILTRLGPEDFEEPETEPEPDRAELEQRYDELYGQKPHPKMKLETLIDRIERKA